MAENSSSAKKPKIAQQLTLKSGVYSVDIKEETNVVFQDKETNEETRAHRSVLSQASPFFNIWLKEQWQKEKDTTEYPVPGDIDWEVFTNVILFLYGKEVQFEEEALPKIYNAAHFLQLENLKVAIVVSLTDQWELKDSSIVCAMCTAIAPHTDPRVVSGLLYMVSVRYLIRNIPTIVENDDIDISSLPIDTVMEIAQSEEVAAPEIELYNFLRKWAEKHKHSLSFMEVQTLFGHIRYATIPHPQLIKIKKCTLSNNEKLQSALSDTPDFREDEMVETKQYINRKSQEGQLLLNGPHYKKWTTKVTKLPTGSPLYTVISDERKGAVVVTRIPRNTNLHSEVTVCFSIISLSKPCAKQSISGLGGTTSVSKIKNMLSVSFRNTVVMLATQTGIQVKEQDESQPDILKFTEPFPWLVTIAHDSHIGYDTITVQTV